MVEEKTIRDQILYKIEHISKLATLPNVAHRIIELVNSPNTTASDLERAITTDQVLASRILKMANSAYYGFQREISTIKLAIVILGFEALRGVVLSSTIIQNLSIQSEMKHFSLKSFWDHAVATAIISQSLSKPMGHPVTGEAFVSGLLHDIGLLVLVEEFPDLFTNLLDRVDQNNSEKHLEELEQELYNCTHHEIGYWLMNKWNFPEQLKGPILSHHVFETMKSHQRLGKIIQIADLMSGFLGYHGPLEIGNYEERLLDLLTPKEMAHFTKISEEAMEKGQMLISAIVDR